MEVHLELCLQGSTVNREEGFPILIPNSGSYTLHEHCELEQQTVRVEENYDRQVWELMVALWGNVPGINEERKFLPIYMYNSSKKLNFNSDLIPP